MTKNPGNTYRQWADTVDWQAIDGSAMPPAAQEAITRWRSGERSEELARELHSRFPGAAREA